MSAKATDWAWNQDVSGNSKLVLLCLADTPNATLLDINKKTGASLKTIKQTLDRLQKDGLITATEHSVAPPGYALELPGGEG